jgi:hypothetical protein
LRAELPRQACGFQSYTDKRLSLAGLARAMAHMGGEREREREREKPGRPSLLLYSRESAREEEREYMAS